MPPSAENRPSPWDGEREPLGEGSSFVERLPDHPFAFGVMLVVPIWALMIRLIWLFLV
jgi:hypothetical protein